MTDVVPLIYTINGNVPESSLRYEKKWSVNEELISFVEEWYDGDTLVKNNVHMYAVKGLPPIGGQQAVM